MKSLTLALTKLYPFAWGLYPLLFFYEHNQAELTLDLLVWPIGISLALTSLVWFVWWVFLRIVSRNEPARHARSALLTITTLFFVYSHARVVFVIQQVVPAENGYVSLACAFVALMSMWKLSAYQSVREHLVSFAQIVGILLISISLVSIISYELRRPDLMSGEKPQPTFNKNQASQPDIYYLIFDRYANQHVLKEFYNFDNTPFIDGLEERGFYIADQSAANYTKTILSVTSSLNMKPLQKLPIVYDGAKPRIDSLTLLFKDNALARYLKGKGYRFIYSGDTWGPIAHNEFADANYSLFNQKDVFEQTFLSTTMFNFIAQEFLHTIPHTILFSENRMRDNRLYKAKVMKKISAQPGPKFVYMHMLLPHDPYVFDAECQPIVVEDADATDADYLAQLQCTSQMIEQMVDNILAASDGKAIIVLQSDEGPFMKRYFDLHEETPWTTLPDAAYRSHVPILNAYYLPQGDLEQDPDGLLYRDTTPVNSFRLILNAYFGEKLKLYPDDTYLTPEQALSTKYHTITHRVKPIMKEL
jgi:Sulfatase